VLGNDETNE
jgi:acylphosphatase